MRTALILIFFFSFFLIQAKDPEPSNIQSLSSITGQITDQSTGEGLPGVALVIAGSDIKVYTDFDGNFTFNNITPGEYTIIAEYVSYRKRIIRAVKTGQVFNLIKLQSDSITITKTPQGVVSST
jgi:hypothetical protein